VKTAKAALDETRDPVGLLLAIREELDRLPLPYEPPQGQRNPRTWILLELENHLDAARTGTKIRDAASASPVTLAKLPDFDAFEPSQFLKAVGQMELLLSSTATKGQLDQAYIQLARLGADAVLHNYIGLDAERVAELLIPSQAALGRRNLANDFDLFSDPLLQEAGLVPKAARPSLT
jgi:hypothetical protein